MYEFGLLWCKRAETVDGCQHITKSIHAFLPSKKIAHERGPLTTYGHETPPSGRIMYLHLLVTIESVSERIFSFIIFIVIFSNDNNISRRLHVKDL